MNRYYVIKWMSDTSGGVWRTCLDTLDEGYGERVRDRVDAHCERLNELYPERWHEVFVATVEWKPVRARRKR